LLPQLTKSRAARYFTKLNFAKPLNLERKSYDLPSFALKGKLCIAAVKIKVDMLASDIIRAYQASTPETPEIFRQGDNAHAEPVVPG
jgi:hypothetical protein